MLAVLPLALLTWVAGCSSVATRNPAQVPSKDVLPPVSFQATASIRDARAREDCSAFLVRFDSSAPTDKGLLVTNAHCIDSKAFPAPGSYQRKPFFPLPVKFLAPEGKIAGVTLTRTLILSTLTHSDIAVLQLEETYSDLHARWKLEPLTLSRTSPRINDGVFLVSGFLQKQWTCSVDALVPELQEGQWHFRDAVRLSSGGCSPQLGASGSPLIHTLTGQVVAIQNTLHEGSKPMCQVSSPCERDAPNAAPHEYRGRAYAQQVTWLYDCIDPATRALRLENPGCPLKGLQLQP